LCGGARLAGALYDEIDELVLKVNPVVLGTGTPLFRGATS
jgi:dihydrofolate reductase